MELYLVRHGQSVGNTMPDRDMPDSPLTERGLVQAGHAAMYLRERGITAIFASPLIRAMQSAQPLAQMLHLPVQVRKELYEVREGDLYMGPSLESLLDYVPEATFQDTIEKDGWVYPGGDYHELVVQRAREVLRQLRMCGEERIAVFCHGNFNEYLIREALGIASSAHIRFPQANTGMNHIIFREHATELIKLNDTTHLEAGQLFYQQSGV